MFATAVIHGRLVMENRRILTLDVEEVMGHVRDIAKDHTPLKHAGIPRSC